MKDLSISEFREMSKVISSSYYIFESEGIGIKISNRYTEVICSFAPDRVCFKNNYGFLCLSGIKSIKYNADDQSPEHIFYITCGNACDNSNSISYTIIADKKYPSKS